MSLQSSHSRIDQSHNQLLRAWTEVSKEWSDEVAINIFDQYIDPLRGPVNAAEERLQIMDKMLRTIRRECEIEDE